MNQSQIKYYKSEKIQNIIIFIILSDKLSDKIYINSKMKCTN